jgi:hypothetical protein
MVIRNIVIIALIAAAVCVSIVLLTHKALMPSGAQLVQLDDLVKQKAQAASVRRLAAPDRIEKVGDAKFGYFTYVINAENGEKRAHVDWRIDKDKVELVSIKFEGNQ